MASVFGDAEGILFIDYLENDKTITGHLDDWLTVLHLSITLV